MNCPLCGISFINKPRGIDKAIVDLSHDLYKRSTCEFISAIIDNTNDLVIFIWFNNYNSKLANSYKLWYEFGTIYYQKHFLHSKVVSMPVENLFEASNIKEVIKMIISLKNRFIENEILE